jgi:PAS domain S-box-containing protein
MSDALILILDDDRPAGVDIRTALTGIGYRVPDPVMSGSAAASKAEELKPDLVIADISLRGEAGVIETVRQIQKATRVPVIYLADDSSPEMFRRALETGPLGYLVKPVGVDDLRAAVASALQKSGLARKLLESEELYRTLFEESPEPIVIFSRDGLVLDINPAYEQFTGYAREETIGVIFTKLPILEQKHMPEYLEIYRNMLRGNKLHRMDIPVIHKNGKRMYVEIFISSLVKDGKITSFQIIARDITEQKKAIIELQASEERYRSLVETSPNAVALADLEARFITVNRQFLAMFGFGDIDELHAAGITVLDLVADEDRERATQNIEKLLSEGSAKAIEYLSVRKDGTIFPVETSVTLIRDESGTPYAFLGVARDISERKRLEHHLKKELGVNAALADLSESIIRPDVTVEDMSEMVLKHAKELTGSEHGYVGVIDQKTGDLISHTLTGMMGKECGITGIKNQIIFPVNPDGSYNALWGYSLNTRKPFYTNSPGQHAASKGIPRGHIPVRNLLSVPAIADRTLLGQISLANGPGEYTDRDLETVSRIANLYALALQRLNYQNELKEANELLEQRVRERTEKLWNEVEERKKAELKLREGEEVARALINSPSEPVFLASADGTVIDLNSELEKRLGLAKSEIIGRSMFDFISKRTAARYREKMDAVAASGKAVRFENQLGDSWYDTIMYPVPDHRGTVTKVAVFSHDITETRRLQKDIMEISELERNRIGQELHDGLGQKLTGIAFLAEALKRTMKEKDYPEVSDVEEITANIAESIDQARKISSGLWTTRLESYDAERALLELADDTENLFGITCKLESHISNPVYNSAAVINLYFIARESINNAIRHGRASRIEIRLSDDPESLYLEVIDNGIGAAATFQEGSGIGLRIMRYRAGIIGGTCSFENIRNGFAVRVTIRKEFIDTYL